MRNVFFNYIIYHCLIIEGRRNISLLWSNTEYEQMRKRSVEFLRKFQNHGIKIARVNSICVAKHVVFFNILRVSDVIRPFLIIARHWYWFK